MWVGSGFRRVTLAITPLLLGIFYRAAVSHRPYVAREFFRLRRELRKYLRHASLPPYSLVEGDWMVTSLNSAARGARAGVFPSPTLRKVTGNASRFCRCDSSVVFEALLFPEL